MNPVGVRGNRHIDTIVHYQQRTRARANLPKPQRQLIELARRQIFLAQLQRDRTGRRRRQRTLARRDEIATLHDMPISDQIKPKPDAPISFLANHSEPPRRIVFPYRSEKQTGAILIWIAPVLGKFVIIVVVAYAGAAAKPPSLSPRRIASKRLPPR